MGKGNKMTGMGWEQEQKGCGGEAEEVSPFSLCTF